MWGGGGGGGGEGGGTADLDAPLPENLKAVVSLRILVVSDPLELLIRTSETPNKLCLADWPMVACFVYWV